MRWLHITREPTFLTCAYCGHSGSFLHSKSYEHNDDTFSLYECSNCRSLIYDLQDIDAPIVSQFEPPGIPNAARYVIETGFSSHFVAECALSVLPEMPEAELRKRIFVDIGAGMGMASYFIKTLFGLKTVTVEPSYTGKLSHEILGLEVHRAYFENLPKEVLTELADKPCLLHLNSVVEHLVDPAAVLADIVGRANVEVLTAVVPDGAAIDFEGPFLAALPFLSPRDHRHLPTRHGMELLLKRLGFQHVYVKASAALLTAIGSRAPMALPKEREIKLAETLFLENLLRHPNPMVSIGGASRLLPRAVINNDRSLLAQLLQLLPHERKAAELLAKVRGRSWAEIPWDLGPSCYWLAYDAFRSGRVPDAIALLDITKAFADALAEDHPSNALTPLEFKWAAMLLESHILTKKADFAAAEIPLRAILDSKLNPKGGARAGHLHKAEAELAALKAKAEKLRQSVEVVRDRA